MASATSYELAGRIAGDRIAVFRGRRADGVMVLMHQLTPGFDHSDVLTLGIAYMLRNRPGNTGLIWDLVELGGLTYLVTADNPDCLELSGCLAREVGHAFAPEAEVTAQVPPAAPEPAASSLVGFTPFLGSIQSTSGTLSRPPATRPLASSGPGPLLTSSHPKPVGAFTAISAAIPPEPAPKAVEPSRPQTPEPHAAPQPDPLAVPLPAFLGAPQAPVTPPAPAAPAVYILEQPKAGPFKTILFTAVGFLVVAALFWIAITVVRGMK